MLNSVIALVVVLLMASLLINRRRKELKSGKYTLMEISNELLLVANSNTRRKARSLIQCNINSSQRWNFKIRNGSIFLSKYYGKNQLVQLKLHEYTIALTLPNESSDEVIINFAEAQTIIKDVFESKEIFLSHLN